MTHPRREPPNELIEAIRELNRPIFRWTVIVTWLALLICLAISLVARAADPIVGKPIDYPPAWLKPLPNLRPCLSAIAGDPFDNPVKNFQRLPAVGFLRIVDQAPNHAGIIDAYRPYWTGIGGGPRLSVPVVSVQGGLLFGSSVPTAAAGNLVLYRNPGASQAKFGYSRLDVANQFVRDGVAAAWTDKTTPVISFVPIGNDQQADDIAAGTIPVPPTIPQTWTVLGHSDSLWPWVVYVANAANAMPADVFDGLKTSGKLCDVLSEVTMAGVSDVTPNVKFKGVLYPDVKGYTTAEHLTIVTAICKRANGYQLVADPFDVWFAAHPNGTLREAWDAGRASK